MSTRSLNVIGQSLAKVNLGRTAHRDVQLVKLPSAKLALFLNSFGVAAGSAMITARHSLQRRPSSPHRSDSEVQGGTVNPGSASRHGREYHVIFSEEKNCDCQGRRPTEREDASTHMTLSTTYTVCRRASTAVPSEQTAMCVRTMRT